MTKIRIAQCAVVVLCMVALAGCPQTWAAEKVGPGDKMPDFTMKDYNGNEHSLSKYEGKIVVIAMSSQYCPWSKAADQELQKMHEEYKDKDVVLLSIDSHNSTPPEDIKPYAKEAGLTYPILKDEGNKYADKLGATRTPEMYVVNTEGTVVYHGAFDNRKTPTGDGETNYAADAVNAVMTGATVEPAEVNAWGCTIKRAS